MNKNYDIKQAKKERDNNIVREYVCQKSKKEVLKSKKIYRTPCKSLNIIAKPKLGLRIPSIFKIIP